jgi:integrase
VPAFASKLRVRDGSAVKGLEFLLLTALRASEALEARWSEIDVAAGLMTIAPERMKNRKPHVVPLSGRALEILRSLPRQGNSDFVFASPKLAGRPVTTVKVRNLLAELAGKDVTLHGFRSAFRDWVGDETSFPREIAELALAHKVGDSVEAAYRRKTAIEKRRGLMKAWAGYCGGSATAEVLPLKRKAAQA